MAVDQGGGIETTRPTTHSDPTFTVDGIVHYCVANTPGAVGHTSTYALCNVTLPYVLKIADNGLAAAAGADSGIAHAVNRHDIHDRKVTNQAVADTFNLDCAPFPYP